MNRVLTVIFSFERFDLLRLCLLFAFKYIKPYSDIFVIDDGSTDARIAPYLQMLNRQGHIKYLILKPENLGIGFSRHEAVTFFMENGQYKYLVQIDSDIIIGPGTIKTAIDDFEYLQTENPAFETAPRYWWNPGAVAFYHLYQIVSRVHTERGQFGMQLLSGEAAFLTSREIIEKVGNTFIKRRHSEADEFWHSLYQCGLQLVTRLKPQYQVQHIGINSNVVFNNGFVPDHSRRFLTDYEGKFIDVKNFHAQGFVEARKTKDMAGFVYETMKQLQIKIPLETEGGD